MLTRNGTNGVMGQRLHNRYKVIQVLGVGGMGQTYLAEDTQLPSRPTCVVKQLKPANNDSNFSSNARRLFQGEAEALDRLGKHNQIPQLLAYFEEDQEFYLVQEFIDGHPLTNELQLGQRWLEPQVVQFLQEVLSILEFVHGQNSIHRDIKPDNLIRRRCDNRLVLIDFGAVKQVRMQQATGFGQASLTIGIGTPGYMPTEQSKGTPRPNSDLYALGMVAIQALTGLLPTQLREDEDGEVIWRDHAEVSNELADFLTNMVRYHFKHRYKSATEALRALQQLSSAQNRSNTSAPSTGGSYNPTVEAPPAESTPTVAFEIPLPLTSVRTASQTQVGIGSHGSETTDTVPSRKRRWIVGGISLLLTGLLAGGSFLVFNQMRRQEQQVLLEQIQQLQVAGNYDECIVQAEAFPNDNPNLHAQVQEILNQCRTSQARQLLADAQELMESDRLIGSINLLKRISPNIPTYEQARSLIGEWSDEILSRAANQYETGKFDTAIAMANAIPQDNTAYQDAQESIKHWSEEWQSNEGYLQTAQQKLNNGEWQAAIDEASKVTTDYWKQQAQPVITKATDELHLNAARTALEAGRWRPAIEEANKVTANYRKQEVEDIINRANAAIARASDEEHLTAARRALEERRWQDAIAEAEKVRTNYGKEQAEAIIAQAQVATRPIREDGVLGESAPQLDDGSYYRDHTFEGNEGQTVTITMESQEFDTYLILIGPDGQKLADDDADGTNSSIRFTLPQTGTYWVRANAFDASSQGRYTLTIQRDR